MPKVDWNDLMRGAYLAVSTTDEILARDLMRQIIYRRAEYMAAAIQVCGIWNLDDLAVKTHWPSEIQGEYPLAEGALPDFAAIEWYEFLLELEKWAGRIMITDEAKVRELQTQQVSISLRRLAEDLAIKKETNILNTIVAGAGATAVVVAGTYEWDAANADPVGDIMDAWQNVLTETTGITPADMGNVAVLMPAAVYGEVMKLEQINNIDTTVAKWLGDSYGFQIIPTKLLTDDAYLLIKGADTVVHGVYTGGMIPMAESKRTPGVGDEYHVRQYFASTIVPLNEGDTTTTKICKIENVVA